MILFRDFNRETEKLLLRVINCSKFPQVRNRAKCILLTYQDISITHLIQIFRVSRKTLYNWFDRWEKQGFAGLYDVKGRGRKTKLNIEQQEKVKEWVKAEPKNLKKVILRVKEEWGIELNKETIKRIIKKLNMTWRRMKRGLSKKPKEWELEVKSPKLLELKEQDEKGIIDLRYFDETGFSLTPCVPYGWQEKGATITINSSRSKRVNILGLMNRRNQLDYEIHATSINSNIVIDFLDKFSNNLDKPTVIVMDQASVHTSNDIMDKLEAWEQKGLTIFWLPPYSPKLNLIEILWKFMKYEWIEVQAYTNWNTLINYLKKVLDNFGNEYVINFV